MKLIKNMTEPELCDLLDAAGKQIVEAAIARKVERPLFALLIFNDPDSAQYVCNCNRQDAIQALRATADRLENRDAVERVPFGATGEYPEGKMHDDDEGGLNFGIAADTANGKVIIKFGKPIGWLGMNASEARSLAAALVSKAQQIEKGK